MIKCECGEIIDSIELHFIHQVMCPNCGRIIDDNLMEQENEEESDNGCLGYN